MKGKLGGILNESKQKLSEQKDNIIKRIDNMNVNTQQQLQAGGNVASGPLMRFNSKGHLTNEVGGGGTNTSAPATGFGDPAWGLKVDTTPTLRVQGAPSNSQPSTPGASHSGGNCFMEPLTGTEGSQDSMPSTPQSAQGVLTLPQQQSRSVSRCESFNSSMPEEGLDANSNSGAGSSMMDELARDATAHKGVYVTLFAEGMEIIAEKGTKVCSVQSLSQMSQCKTAQ